MNQSSSRKFGGLHSERAPSFRSSNNDGRPSNGVLVGLMLVGLGVGTPGIIIAWPQAVDALRQSGRLVKSTATLADMRVVEVPDTRREGATIWRKEGLFEFQTSAVDRRSWATIGEFQKRSEVVPGGYGERHTVWFDPETDTLTTYPPNQFHHWFLLMFYMVLGLAGFSSALVLAQRLLEGWQEKRAAAAAVAAEADDDAGK